MKKLIGMFCCCILFTSCSLSTSVYQGINLLDGEGASTLYNIRIVRWGDLQFSGLLVLQYRQDGLYYVVLDATGVKLIEAEVTLSDDHRLIRALGPLKKSQLPRYLSISLKRIYLLEPLQSPCSHEFMLSFCRERLQERGWRKYVESGPFTVWEVSKNGMDGDKEDLIVYSQPWLGMKVVLEEKNTLRQIGER